MSCSVNNCAAKNNNKLHDSVRILRTINYGKILTGEDYRELKPYIERGYINTRQVLVKTNGEIRLGVLASLTKEGSLITQQHCKR